MIRRIAASVAALVAASVLVAPAAQADEVPVSRHAIVRPDPAPSLARHIDWD